MAAKKDLEYYLAQARRIEEHREAGAEKELRKLYKSMLKDLQQLMSDTYIQYSKDDRLSYAILQEAGYHARFLEEVEQRLNLATPAMRQELHDLVEETYAAAYEAMIKGVMAQGIDGFDPELAQSLSITPDQIKAAVENPVSGLTLTDTLEKNRKDIVYSIKQTIGIGLMNGDRYSTMANRIVDRVDGDYRKAIRIARTEAHRVREMGNMDAALRVDEELQKGSTGLRMVKTWRTMKDEKVRPQRAAYKRKPGVKPRKKNTAGWRSMLNGPNHVKMEGQVRLVTEKFDLGSYKGAKVEAMAPTLSGVAAHDIQCRCYASEELMTDEQYFKLTGKHFPGYEEAKATPLPVSAYTPSGSVEEAERFARDNGVKYADYSKLPLETANQLNYALTTLPDDVRPVFVGASNTLEEYWGGKLPRGSKHYYGVTIETFNGIHLGFGTMPDFDTSGYMVGISSSYKTADKITAAKKAAQEKYMQKYGRKWFYNETGESTALHEMGHVYVNTKGLPTGFETAAARWAKETGCAMLEKPTEAWAEAWAAYHLKDDNLPEYISKYVASATAEKSVGAKVGRLISFEDDGIIRKKELEFKQMFEEGKIRTILSPQKQSRHIKGTKQFEQYAAKLNNIGDHPAYIREDMTVRDVRNAVTPKLTGNVHMTNGGSYREFVDFDDTIGYYYDKSNAQYMPTKRAQITYAEKDGNFHVVPVKEFKRGVE